jgi:hypothetical protein
MSWPALPMRVEGMGATLAMMSARLAIRDTPSIHALADCDDTNLEFTPDGPDPDVPGSPDFRTLLRGQDHPMDVIFGSVAYSLLPGDWIGAVAGRHGRAVGDSLLALRFAIASDDRQGEFQSAPPLAPCTRPVTCLLPLAAQPRGGVSNPESDQWIDLQTNATIEIGDPRPETPVNPKRAGNIVPAALLSPQRMGGKIGRPIDVDRAAAA